MNKASFYLSFLLIFIFYLSFNVLSGYIKIYVILSLFLISLVSFVQYYKKIINPQFALLSLYAIIVLFNSFTGDEYLTFTKSLLDILYLFVPFAMLFIYIGTKDYKRLKMLLIFILFISFILSITSIPQLYADPMLLREEFKEEDGALAAIYARRWLSTYGKAHSLPFIFPPLVYIIKNSINNNKRKILFFLFFLIYFMFILLSSATGAILITVFAIGVSFLIRTNKSIKYNLLMLFLISLPALLLLNNDILYYSLDMIQPLFRGSSTYNKINLIKLFLENDSLEGGFGVRNNLHGISWNTFLDNFLLGTNKDSEIGHHSFFLDRLALLGMVGFIPLILFLLSYVRKIYNILNKTKLYYLVGVFSYFLMFSIKNPFSFEMWLYALFVLPGLCFYSETLLNKK